VSGVQTGDEAEHDRTSRTAALRTLLTRGAGGRGAAEALAWLYLYSVVWLVAYAVLATLVFGWRPVVITGGSMGPRILPGDLVMVADLQDRAGLATVLTFRRPGGELVTHRVTQVLPEGYRTRGDANATEDSDVVPSDHVFGVGRLLIPLLGRPLYWLRSGALVPLALWLLASVAAVLMVSRRRDDEPRAPTARPAPRPDLPAALVLPSSLPVQDVLPGRPARRRGTAPIWTSHA